LPAPFDGCQALIPGFVFTESAHQQNAGAGGVRIVSPGGAVMKLIGCFAGAALVAVVLAAALPARGEPVTLQVESALPAAIAASKAMDIFKDETIRLSEGSMDVEVTKASQRSIRELIDAVRVGQIFATWMSVGLLSRMVPEITAVSLPFVSDNYDQARRAVAGPVGTLISKKLEAKGFILLAWMDLGALEVSNSIRPLRTLADFKGLRIRVLPIPTHTAVFKAIGAHPLAIELPDVDAALRQGDVDGLELDYSAIYAKKFYENQRYLSNTGHFLDFQIVLANKAIFAGLDPGQQRAVREAAAIAAVRQHTIATEDEATALAWLKEKGMEFDPLPAATRAALRRAAAGVIDDARQSIGAEVVNQVLAANRRPAAIGVSDNRPRR
jgi:TRAP-type transport system periplasmic protein